MVSRFGLGECPAAVLFSRFNRLNQSPGFSQESIRLGIFVPRRLLNNLLKARENGAGLSNGAKLIIGHGLKRQSGRGAGNKLIGLSQSCQSRFVLTQAVLGDCKSEQVSCVAALQMTNGLNRAKRQAKSHGGMEWFPQNGPTGLVEPAQFLRELIWRRDRRLGRRFIRGDWMEQFRYRVFCQRLVGSGAAKGLGDIANQLPAFFE